MKQPIFRILKQLWMALKMIAKLPLQSSNMSNLFKKNENGKDYVDVITFTQKFVYPFKIRILWIIKVYYMPKCSCMIQLLSNKATELIQKEYCEM